MKLIRYLAAACAFIAVGHQPTWAQDGDDKKLPVISKKWHLVYDVERDGRSTQTFESRNQVVLANALEIKPLDLLRPPTAKSKGGKRK